MGLFNRKEKAYSLAEAMRKLQDEEFKNYIAVPTNPDDILHTKYWLRLDENLLKEVPYVETPFQEKRRKMMKEIGVDEECKKRTEYVSRSHSTRPGRVVPSYNNWQGAKKYNQGNQYGQYR